MSSLPNTNTPGRTNRLPIPDTPFCTRSLRHPTTVPTSYPTTYPQPYITHRKPLATYPTFSHPANVAPGSPLDSLSPSYRQEAVRWVQFHAECSVIPGIHVPFTSGGLKHYLEFRARSSKCISQILCKLKKMGQVCGFVLCTSKYQQPYLQ